MTGIAASRSLLEGGHVFNLGVQPVDIPGWVATVGFIGPEGAGQLRVSAST